MQGREDSRAALTLLAPMKKGVRKLLLAKHKKAAQFAGILSGEYQLGLALNHFLWLLQLCASLLSRKLFVP